MSVSFQQAREAYANRAALRSAHTLQAYLRAIDLFLDCLDDRGFAEKLAIHGLRTTTIREVELNQLTSADEEILAHFVRWLATPSEQDKRPYAQSTIELRLAGVQRWLEFAHKENWLPDGFSLENTIRQMKTAIQPQHQSPIDKAVGVQRDLTQLIEYYDTQKSPRHLQNNPEKLGRWELTRLRNRALIKMLAETGGQVSAILSLNADIFDNTPAEMVIEVIGKNAHPYPIYLKDSLPAVRDYLGKRVIADEKKATTPVFVSHDARYEGQRMSRIIAWRIIQRAARAVGLPDVSPHDLRHWCAQEWIGAGSSLEDVKKRLGHRSMHTVRVYYGHFMDETSDASEG